MSKFKVIPGVNIQWPWSQLLVSGQKTVETRSYPLPPKYLGVELAIIETPGPKGKKSAGIDRARIIGTITFGESIHYKTRKSWLADRSRHLVAHDDPQFSFDSTKPKWGWTVLAVKQFDEPTDAPLKRGIVFASACKV